MLNPDVYTHWPVEGGARNRLAWNGKHLKARDCCDCAFLRGYVTWWCRNERAIEAHGSAIPPRTNCSFWEPCPRDPAPLLVRLGRKIRARFEVFP